MKSAASLAVLFVLLAAPAAAGPLLRATAQKHQEPQGVVAKYSVAASISDGPKDEYLDDVVKDIVKKQMKKQAKKKVEKKLEKVDDEIESLEKKLKKAKQEQKKMNNEYKVVWPGCKDHKKSDSCDTYCDRSKWFRTGSTADHYTCAECLRKKISCFKYGSYKGKADEYCASSCSKKNMQRKQIDSCFACLEDQVHKSEIAEKDKELDKMRKQVKKCKKERKECSADSKNLKKMEDENKRLKELVSKYILDDDDDNEKKGKKQGKY